MTNEKARDFFSAHYEGTLEPGLSVSLEQHLKSNADVKREYESFVRAMGDLDMLKFESIEIPSDLHDKISARLDRHLYERKRNATPVWGTWLRGLAFAGVGALAIVGAIFAFNNRGQGPAAAGAFVAPAPPKISVTSEGVSLDLQRPGKTVIVSDQTHVVSRSVIGDQPLVLSNSRPEAAVFKVQIAGELGATYVAIPGRTRLTNGHGNGTIAEFANAIAGYFQMPVTVDANRPSERISWAFASSDAVSEASKALGPNYSVTSIASGPLEIKYQR